jgi:hypothetical protein
MALVLTAGQRSNSPQFTVVLERIRVPRLGVGRPRTCPVRVLADKAYSSRANRLQSRVLQGASRRRVRDQQAQAKPRDGHPL